MRFWWLYVRFFKVAGCSLVHHTRLLHGWEKLTSASLFSFKWRHNLLAFIRYFRHVANHYFTRFQMMIKIFQQIISSIYCIINILSRRAPLSIDLQKLLSAFPAFPCCLRYGALYFSNSWNGFLDNIQMICTCLYMACVSLFVP